MTMNDDERLKRDEATVRRDFWRKLGKFAAQIPFAEEALTAYYCAMDRRTPTHVRVALIGALIYFISPLDLFPDVIKLVWDQIKPEHRDAAHEALERMNKASET
jgi:uncharacterized membrane protein YkvA (DUF1232 family)